MGMSDRETVALTVGGHTFGKVHGNGPADAVGGAPEEANIHEQGVGWANKHETGLGEYTITSGLEGVWTPTPTKWDNTYLETIFSHEWKVKKSPAGANQWEPVEVKDGFWVPDAHVEGRKNPPVMNAADMAMIVDPDYLKISKEYRDNPDVLADEFARAWYKLLHRDMGPSARYLGPQVPNEVLVWQDPVPKHEGPLVSDEQIATLKQAIADPELTAKQLVETAWASACTYRQTDHRGGANGARIRLEPQTANRLGYQRARRRGGCDRPVGEDKGASEANISLADVIVLGGGVGVEMAAKAAGHELTVPFTPGRTDTS
nr:peroxidase family protein [Halomonas populi]